MGAASEAAIKGSISRSVGGTTGVTWKSLVGTILVSRGIESTTFVGTTNGSVDVNLEVAEG